MRNARGGRRPLRPFNTEAHPGIAGVRPPSDRVPLTKRHQPTPRIAVRMPVSHSPDALDSHSVHNGLERLRLGRRPLFLSESADYLAPRSASQASHGAHRRLVRSNAGVSTAAGRSPRD